MSKKWNLTTSYSHAPKQANKAQLKLGCINHTCLNTTRDGYGVVPVNRGSGGYQTAHKLAYCLSVGIEYDAMPRGKLTHTCKNKRCINPEHIVFTAYKTCIDGARMQAHKARLARLILTVPDQHNIAEESISIVE